MLNFDPEWHFIIECSLKCVYIYVMTTTCIDLLNVQLFLQHFVEHSLQQLKVMKQVSMLLEWDWEEQEHTELHITWSRYKNVNVPKKKTP